MDFQDEKNFGGILMLWHQEAGSFFWRKEVFFRMQEVIVLKTFSDTFCPTAAARVCGFYLSTDDESSPLSSP